MVIPSKKSIVLLGFMGSGKSTLGKQLALSLGWTFTDLDRFIETEENRTIPDLFEKEGEDVFRKLETHALKRVLAYSNQVISIGGGAPCTPSNMELIKEKSISIYLKISEQQLLKRLGNSSVTRPLLKGKADNELQQLIARLLVSREPYYLQADIILESDDINTGMILDRLESFIS
jgi:shikimate kinase